MFSSPYSHLQMGKVERRHKHIIDTDITMLNFAKISTRFWDFLVLTTTFLNNLNPSQILGGIPLMKHCFYKNRTMINLKISGANATHV